MGNRFLANVSKSHAYGLRFETNHCQLAIAFFAAGDTTAWVGERKHVFSAPQIIALNTSGLQMLVHAAIRTAQRLAGHLGIQRADYTVNQCAFLKGKAKSITHLAFPFSIHTNA